MAGYARSKGTPAAEMAVAGTGRSIAARRPESAPGLPSDDRSRAIGDFPHRRHLPHACVLESRAAGKDVQMVNFTKNLALLGFVLMTIAIPRPWPYSPQPRRASDDARDHRRGCAERSIRRRRGHHDQRLFPARGDGRPVVPHRRETRAGRLRGIAVQSTSLSFLVVDYRSILHSLFRNALARSNSGNSFSSA